MMAEDTGRVVGREYPKRGAPVKVVLFLPSLRGGGAEKSFLHLSMGFAQHGAETAIVLSRAEGVYISYVPQGVRVVDLKARRVLFSLHRLVRYLRHECPDVLISALDHANVTAILARHLARVPTKIIVTVHSTPSRVVANASTLRARLLPLWVKPFYPRAHAVVAVSQGVADELVHNLDIPAEKVHTIYNPIITPELFEKAEEPLEHPWFAENEPPVVLGVGRLTPAKDFATLLRAFALVRAERPARLIILGEGELRPELENLTRELGIEEDVALPGFVPNPYPYMKRAGVFVLSSRWEGLPTVLVEALAVGTPVVSTDCPSGPAEILEGGRFGPLVKQGDEKALAHAVLHTLQQPRSPVQAHVYERFTIEYALKHYVRLIDEVCQATQC